LIIMPRRQLFISTLLSTPASSVASARIDAATSVTLRAFCERYRCSQSDALRRALTLLSGSTDEDPDAAIAAVAVALGLDAETPAEDVLSAVQDLVSSVTAASDGASSEAADPPAPPPGTAPAFAVSSLSAAQLAACKRAGLSPQQFVVHLANAMKRGRTTSAAPSAAPAPVALTRAQIDGCKKLGITHNEFRARMAAVRRV